MSTEVQSHNSQAESIEVNAPYSAVDIPPHIFMIGRACTKLTGILGSYEASGSENIPQDTGCIVVPNHNSYFDPLVVTRFLDEANVVPQFMIRDDLFDKPVLGKLLRQAKQVPIKRVSKYMHEAIDKAATVASDGGCVVIYPEGTSKGVEFDPGALGPVAAKAALEADVPVIPVAQWGAHKVINRYAERNRDKLNLWPNKTFRVAAGEAVDLSDARELYGDNEKRQAIRLAKHAIGQAIHAELIRLAIDQTAQRS